MPKSQPSEPEAFPHVPEEIVRLIIEAAAESPLQVAVGQPAKLSEVLYTCKRFTSWALPCIYRSIYLVEPRRVQLLRQTLSGSSLLASYVRSLAFSHVSKVHHDLSKIVLLCPNLTSFACTSLRDAEQHLDFSNNPTLRRLSYDIGVPPIISNLTPNLRNLTHLDAVAGSGAWYPTLRLLPNLSHLFLRVENLNPQHAEVARIFPALPQTLRICILHAALPPEDSEADGIRLLALGQIDPRIVIHFDGTPVEPDYPFLEGFIADLLTDWSLFNKGKKDFWEMAEEIVIQRHTEGPRSNTVSSVS